MTGLCLVLRLRTVLYRQLNDVTSNERFLKEVVVVVSKVVNEVLGDVKAAEVAEHSVGHFFVSISGLQRSDGVLFVVSHGRDDGSDKKFEGNAVHAEVHEHLVQVERLVVVQVTHAECFAFLGLHPQLAVLQILERAHVDKPHEKLERLWVHPALQVDQGHFSIVSSHGLRQKRTVVLKRILFKVEVLSVDSHPQIHLFPSPLAASLGLQVFEILVLAIETRLVSGDLHDVGHE